MQRLKYYVEMKDSTNLEEWSNKVDIYGYENEVCILSMGFSKTIKTNGVDDTIYHIQQVVDKLKAHEFIVINEEDRRTTEYLLQGKSNS